MGRDRNRHRSGAGRGSRGHPRGKPGLSGNQLISSTGGSDVAGGEGRRGMGGAGRPRKNRDRRGRRGRGQPHRGGDRRGPDPRPGGGGEGRSPVDTSRPRAGGEATLEVRGVLQAAPEGHGFLRSPVNDYNRAESDPYVPPNLVKDLKLETGVEIAGMAVPGGRAGHGPWLDAVLVINGEDPRKWEQHTPFKDLVAEDPSERIRLESRPD